MIDEKEEETESRKEDMPMSYMDFKRENVRRYYFGEDDEG